ncbi:hypothetical protein BDA99DRAFT_531798 [Phascolomyces articulosus]|uniref:Uncharacterized protein n=1 Tax=Phascolomyces articulosus TaxID=60185 RepID=A0AAD5KA68_9FUNG|nr:hypothetical protein BDA99DRAFT_531798 [Phascolomyces articulosus]
MGDWNYWNANVQDFLGHKCTCVKTWIWNLLWMYTLAIILCKVILFLKIDDKFGAIREAYPDVKVIATADQESRLPISVPLSNLLELENTKESTSVKPEESIFCLNSETEFGYTFAPWSATILLLHIIL